jgi:HK97 gp10 family phage protein
MLEVNLTGFAELQAQLDMLPAQIEKKLLRGALRAGVKLILADAKQQIHPVSKALANSLRISTGMKAGTARATLKAGDKTAYYAQWVENGTAAHLIKPKNAHALKFEGGEFSDAKHPGAKKHPFMRPALDAQAQDGSPAFRAVADYLSGRITAELDKLPDEIDETTK